MFKVITVCRTTGRVGDLDIKTDDKGEHKSIWFTVASDRPYKVSGKDGTSTRPTDFMYCRAFGNIAQLIHDTCKYPSGKKVTTKDGEVDVYSSRHLQLTGYLEKFENTTSTKVTNSICFSTSDVDNAKIFIRENKEGAKPIEIPLTKTETAATMSFTTNEAKFLDVKFVVQEIEFLDKDPGKNIIGSSNTPTGFNINFDTPNTNASSGSNTGTSNTGNNNKTDVSGINVQGSSNTQKDQTNYQPINDGNMFTLGVDDKNAPF